MSVDISGPKPFWVAAAAIIGFLGNEAVALLQIRKGREIGSAALVADGLHARTDGLTSLAVLLAPGFLPEQRFRPPWCSASPSPSPATLFTPTTRRSPA